MSDLGDGSQNSMRQRRAFAHADLMLAVVARLGGPELAHRVARFAAAAAAAVKPDFADVVSRAARYRRRRGAFGAAIVALAVAAGGGSTVALTAGRRPTLVKPTPIPSVRPWHTTVPQNASGPQPQPSYTEIQPGVYDPTEPDEKLTGLWTELRAGDLDHLYLEYQDCTGGPCRRMLAATTDRGRTWRKLPMPSKEGEYEPPSATPVQGEYEPPSVALVHGGLVLAVSWFRPKEAVTYRPEDLPDWRYWTSTDAGATWRRSEVREVDALPPGWLVRQEENGIIAVDPATGNMARMKKTGPHGWSMKMVLDTLPSAGIWALSHGPGGLVAEVSQDGGNTWDTRRLPDVPAESVSMSRSTLFTSNGQTVYVAEKRKDSVRLHASGDGGRTWAARAVVDLDGPLLSVLPVDDRVVIVEGVHGTYRSTDQGRTFTRVGPSLGSRAHAIPGGFTIPTNNNQYSAWISPDGAEWTYVRRPEVP